MNTVQCPKCSYVNSLNENFCLNCGTSIAHLPPSNPGAASQPFAPPAYLYQSTSSQRAPQPFGEMSYANTTLGGKVFVWFKVYCGLMTAASLLIVGVGALVIFGDNPAQSAKEKTDAMQGGFLIAAYGLFYVILYGLAIFASRKPGQWVFGIILICLGLASCLFPFALPLLIYWIKPDTKAYFGRSY